MATGRKAENKFENEVEPVLPYGIGHCRWTRLSDGSKMSENSEDRWSAPKPEDRYTDLYKPGYQPFTEIHGVRLIVV